MKSKIKLTNLQFEEAAFIFEKVNGAFHSDYEKGIIEKSELTVYSIEELEKIITDGLNSEIYETEPERVSAYWALSKTNNQKLIQPFNNWLKSELKSKNEIAVFQLLIGLDRFDEPAFHKKRNSRASFETELNIRDAQAYLDNRNK